MAIIRCPSCDQRISSLATSCSHCYEPVGKLSDEQRDRLALRRWRDRLYRARNFTYLSMTLVVIGMIAWWIGEPEGLVLPMTPLAGYLLGAGTTAYVLSWGWLAWLRWRKDPRKDPA